MRRPAVLGGQPAFADPLPFARPLTPPLERVTALLAPSYESGVLTNGPLVRRLEQNVAARLGVDHVVAVASCTAGLMLALRALDPRGPVVLPSFTFAASAHAVAWNGLDIAFAECDGATAQVDVADVERRIGGGPAGAVMATHVFGAPCGVEEVEEAGRRAGIPVMFDAAHALGATSGGRPVGGFGDAEVFSMSPTKMVVAGEGGLVTTNRADVAEAVRLGRDYGNPGDYDCRFVGLNARLSELHAAVAIESLAMLDEHLERRRAVAAAYRKRLSDVPGVACQRIGDGEESTYKDFTIMIDRDRFGLSRDSVVAALAAEGIDTRRYFSPPVHLQQAYGGAAVPSLPVTERLAAQVVSLPMYGHLGTATAEAVAEAVESLQAHAEEVAAASTRP